MEIIFKTDKKPNIEEIINVYISSGIRRPVNDKARIQKMYEHANLIVSAWHGDTLIGVARSLTDFCYCCYLSDLAVRKEFQHQGIGRRLIDLTKEKIGSQTTLVLLSAPAAMDYYSKIGFEKVTNGYIIHRTQ